MEAARKAEETQKAALDAEAIKVSKEAEEKEKINKQKDASVGVLKNPQTAGLHVYCSCSGFERNSNLVLCECFYFLTIVNYFLSW